MSNPNASPRQNFSKATQKINEHNKRNQKNQPSNKKVAYRRGYQSKPTQSQSKMFYDALTCPFDPNVLGVQVPDPFPFPTQVYHVHQTTVIGASSNTPGTGCISFLPNPCLSMIDLGQLKGLSGGDKVVISTPFAAYNASTASPANAIYGAVGPAALADVFADYRLVSWGIKISNLMPELVATGRIIIAQIPLGDTIPSYPALVSALGSQNQISESIYGIDVAFLATSNILELPTGFMLTAQDLLHGDVEIGGMYSSADFWDFKTTRVTGVLGQSQQTGQLNAGDDIVTTGAQGTAWATGYKDLTRCRGGSAIVIFFEGMPASQVSSFFQVETIYHLEGTPNFSSQNNNALVSSTARKTSVGTTQNVEQTMAKASKMENVITWIEKGADFLNKNKATFGKIGAAAMALL